MKKLATNALSVLVILILALPSAVFWVLRGAYWIAEKSVAAIERLRARLNLSDVAEAKWITKLSDWLIG
jgi:hypothetical protein|nr:MAG TPA: hypothetical protein [Caudoviricetes sp.]